MRCSRIRLDPLSRCGSAQFDTEFDDSEHPGLPEDLRNSAESSRWEYLSELLESSMGLFDGDETIGLLEECFG